MKRTVKVSICIITHNQEQYIRNAIKGALKQKTNFPFEIVISDDRSTDSTPEICAKYTKQYPELIRFIRQEQNLGTGRHWIAALQECRGRYVALCEGDDYFSRAAKIQQQYEFMERNPEYTLCSHEVFINHEVLQKTLKGAIGVWIDNLRLSGVRSLPALAYASLFKHDEFWSRRRMYRGNKRFQHAGFAEIFKAQLESRYIHTVSMFARSDLLKKFPMQFLQFAGFHRAVIIWLSLYGSVKHDSEVMSTRVIQSTSSAVTKRERNESKKYRSNRSPLVQFLETLLVYCSAAQRRTVEDYLEEMRRNSEYLDYH